MPSIRLPKSVEPLLQFCHRHDSSRDNACFDTYADLVVFAASVGFHDLSTQKPPASVEFLDSPYPIDLAIFKNQHLFPNLLLMGLAVEGTQDIAKNEQRLCLLVEGYAHEGAKVLVKRLKLTTDAAFHVELAKMLSDAVEEHQQHEVKI
jgi:hypothetical protein